MSAADKVRPYAAQVNNQQESPKSPAETILNKDDEIHIEVNLNTPKAKWEDNYKLQSYYIHKDLLKEFTKVSRKMGKGAKTLLINEGLKYMLFEKPKIDKALKE